MAGRELSGPDGAVADLFSGRPWAVCAGERSAADAIDHVVRLVRECGASPLLLAAEAHDRAVAVSSHLPQVASSVLAGVLVDSEADLRLAGPGLADTTRLAAGDAALWTDILSANAAEVAAPVRTMAGRLGQLADALDALAAGAADAPYARRVVHETLERGNRGRASVPLKRGELSGAFVGLRVVLEDEPGRLAALLLAAGAAGVNVEDVHVEHVPGRPTGVIELLVSPGAVDALREALKAANWHVL